MPRGGSRPGAGRPPDPNSLTEAVRLEAGAIRTLPRTRRGAAPAWPLPGKASTSERAMWLRLWKKPQAIVWDENFMHDQVAMYVRSFIEATELGASSARRTLLLQQENVLLLTLPALLRAGFRISTRNDNAGPATSSRTKKPASNVTSIDFRQRLRGGESDQPTE